MATPNRITVKFKAEGAQALKSAIDSLARVQAKLEGQLKKGNNTYKHLNKNTKVYNKQSILATRNTRLLGGAFATLRSKMLLGAFALTIVNKTVGRLIGLYGEQEDAEKRLEIALGRKSQALLDHATHLQANTRFGDENIISSMALIAAFVDEEEQIKAATQASLDLAAAKGMDLNSAADLVAKTLASETNALSRYGIEVEGAVGSTERLTSLTENMAKAFGGQATKQAETLAGRLERVKGVMGDIGENVGSDLANTVNNIALSFLNLNNMLTDNEIKTFELMGHRAELFKLQQNIISNEIGRFKTTEQMYEREQELIKIIKLLTDSTHEEGKKHHEESMSFINEDLQATDDNSKGKRKSKIDMLRSFLDEEQKALFASFELYKQDLEAFEDKERKKLDAVKRTQFEIKERAISTMQEVTFALASNLDKRQQLEMESLKNEIIYINATDNQKEKMEEDANRKHQSRRTALFRAEQALAISQIIIDTQRGLMYETGTKGLFGLTLGQIIVAQGITSAALVAAQQPPQYEYGGMVGGQRHSAGGTLIEAEQGEFVMNRNAVDSIGVGALNAMNQGGGGVTVNVSGNVLTQDFVEGELAESIQEAVRKGVSFA